MSIERAMVTRTRHHLMSSKAGAIINLEGVKGCCPEISPDPVALEPVYHPVPWYRDEIEVQDILAYTLERPPLPADIVRLRVWVGPEQELDWQRFEIFLKQLPSSACRTGFEIVGNRNQLWLSFLCRLDDLPVLQAAFSGKFADCRLSELQTLPLAETPVDAWQDVAFRDYLPDPPYSNLLTRYEELRDSPLEHLVAALATIPPPGIGFYQALFETVRPDHDWHQNVRNLLDLKYVYGLFGGIQSQQRFQQQSPSAPLVHTANEIDLKAHNDKPMFAAGVRVAVVGLDARTSAKVLQSLAAFMNLFQHGGRPLRYLSQEDYRPHLQPERLRDMFLLGLVHRAGFLLTSEELTGLVHVPPFAILSSLDTPSDLLHSLPPPSEALSIGTPLGISHHGGDAYVVHTPEFWRERHSHLIGVIGVGKTTATEHTCRDDIEKGHGVAVFDPHGDLAERMLCLIPEHRIEDVIYFDLSDPEWVPLWNPLALHAGQAISRTVDDTIRVLKSILTGRGHRLEHLLRQGLAGVLHLEKPSLSVVANVLTTRNPRRERLRMEILSHVETETARRFWDHGINTYRDSDFAPVQNKLGVLLTDGNVAKMLEQPESRFDFRDIIDTGKIFIVNLSGTGSETRDTLGSLFLSLFHLAALTRSDTPYEDRRPFHIYLDEAHRFVTGSIEDLLVETRKYRVSLTLAHQYLSQFVERRTADALGVTGATVVFRVLQRDAEQFCRLLGEEVEPGDLTSLEVGEAIARIGKEVVRIKVPAPREDLNVDIRERIVRSSHERYYKRATESPRPKLQPTQVPASDSRTAKTHPLPNEAEFEYGSL